MTRPRRTGLRPLLCLALAMGVATGQQPDAGWHRFHDKEGNEIEARAVSVSSDLKTVQIYRRDGRSFDLTVTRLSLDDQQYLREWILAESTNDASKARFRVSLNRKEKPLAKEKLSTPIREALWETSELSYGIEVTNLSSASVANLQLEYAILMEDHVDVKPAPEPTDPDQAADEPDTVAQRWRAVPEGSVRYHKGKIPLPLLAFNRPHPLEIGTLVCDTVKTSTIDREDAQDRPIGILIRVVDSQGTVVLEQSDLIRDYSSMNWATVADRIDPSEIDGSGTLISSVAAN